MNLTRRTSSRYFLVTTLVLCLITPACKKDSHQSNSGGGIVSQAPLYNLTVTNGSGSGTYTAGTVVTITANNPASGQVFDRWSTTTAISSPTSVRTTLTMPSADLTVAAIYKAGTGVTYSLVVQNGNGTGNYFPSTTVSISALSPPVGKIFDKWTGASVANLNSPSTTLIMPSANTTVSANFIVAPPQTFTLLVENGSGSGNYTSGTIVKIDAATPASNLIFDSWTGANVADRTNPSTTLTMPAANTTVSALFKTNPAIKYTLTVVNGTGSGAYSYGALVSIAANAPATGQVFAGWTGFAVANANNPTTTLTMPTYNATVIATYVANTASHCIGKYVNVDNAYLEFFDSSVCTLNYGTSASCTCTYSGNSVTISQCSSGGGSVGGTFTNACQDVIFNGLNFARQ